MSRCFKCLWYVSGTDKIGLFSKKYQGLNFSKIGNFSACMHRKVSASLPKDKAWILLSFGTIRISKSKSAFPNRKHPAL